MSFDSSEPTNIVDLLIETHSYLKKLEESGKLIPSHEIPITVSKEVAEDFHNSGLTFWQYFSKYPEQL